MNFGQPNAKTFIIIALILIGLYLLWKAQGHAKTSNSLYDRLGGIFPIAAVVNRFSDEILKNPLVGTNSPNPALRQWSTMNLDRLPGLKWLRTLWVASITGGPYTYVGTHPGKCPFSLEKAHSRFNISSQEFDAVGMELSNALDYYSVPEKEKQEVLGAFSAHKPEITKGYVDPKMC